jgi:cell fate regulator YaaT (PSP1 superfamily)
MRVVEIQFAPWDKVYYFDPLDFVLRDGDKVIVKTELGVELGEVVGFAEIDEKEFAKGKNKEVEPTVKKETESEEETVGEAIIKPIIRKATSHDLEKEVGLSEKKKALDYLRSAKEKLNLPMKFIDVHFAFDGSRATFAFIADGRVDFRDLVKDLTRHFGRTVRLQQIGIRDEAKIMGDYGHCGKKLCCKSHLKELASITSDMAEIQQCSHRGSERISGICGRLMCCLSYEEKGYEEAAKNLPPIGTKVSVDGKKGKVVGHQILKQCVNVEFSGEKGEQSSIVEVDINRNKKKTPKEKITDF